MSTIRKIIQAENILNAVLFISGTLLSLDFWLSSHNMQGLCTSRGCKVSGQLLKFSETHLILAGAVFFWILFLLSFFASRYQKSILWKSIYTVLFGAMAFDGVLLGTQLIEVEIICWLCIGVGGALLASISSLAWVRRSIFLVLLGVSIWIGGFLGQAALYSNLQTPGLSQTDFLEITAKDSKNAQDFYFFFSLHCGHCSGVMINIVANKAFDVNWHLCCLDRGHLELLKLANILQNKKNKTQPFIQILKSKDKKEVKDIHIPSKLRKKVENAWSFFKSSNYNAVPLLVVREKIGRDVYLVGSESIAKYLYEKGLVKRWYSLKTLQKRLNNQ